MQSLKIKADREDIQKATKNINMGVIDTQEVKQSPFMGAQNEELDRSGQV